MSHKSVRLLLQDVAKSLADNIQFDAGRHSEFNMKQSISYPWIWLLPITAQPQFAVNDVEHFQKVWNIALLFFDKDAFDATEGPSNKILDEQDEMVDKFIHRVAVEMVDMKTFLSLSVVELPYMPVHSVFMVSEISFSRPEQYSH